MEEEIKIYVEMPMTTYTIQIWAIRHTGEFNYYINYNPITGEIIEKKQSLNQADTNQKPLLELPRRFGEIFLRSIQEYNSKRGVISDNENLLKGKLTATENHLKDLQDILKTILPASIENKKLLFIQGEIKPELIKD